MYVCMNVCMHVLTLAVTFITIHVHSVSSTHILILYLLLFMHTHSCMPVLFGSFNLTFTFPRTITRHCTHGHGHGHGIFILATHPDGTRSFCLRFHTFFASSIPCVLDCSCYNAFHVRHASHLHCNIYIPHACYSFYFTFSHWVLLHSASFTDMHTHLTCMLLTTVTVLYCLVCTSCTSSIASKSHLPVASNGGHTWWNC
jgi:hypothetical protein